MADLKVKAGDRCIWVKRQGRQVRPMALATVRTAGPSRIYMDFDPPIPHPKQPGNTLREGHAGYNDVLTEDEVVAEFICPQCGGKDCPNCLCSECEGKGCEKCKTTGRREAFRTPTLVKQFLGRK